MGLLNNLFKIEDKKRFNISIPDNLNFCDASEQFTEKTISIISAIPNNINYIKTDYKGKNYSFEFKGESR